MFSSFMINTWIVATLVAVVAGIVGFFVVIRGASFAAHALPLGAFPGAAAASLIGVDPLAGLVAFSVLGVIGIGALGRHGRREIATALCLTMLLGLGALFLSMTSEYSQAVYALLFGEVLGVSDAELVPVAAISAVVIVATMILFRPLLLSSAAPALVPARGLSARAIEIAFLVILGLASAMALPVVGALLVFSLMLGPASAARMMSARPLVALLASVGLALATVWAAIALSWLSNWPVGFFVGGSGLFWYGLGRVCRRFSSSDGVRRLGAGCV